MSSSGPAGVAARLLALLALAGLVGVAFWLLADRPAPAPVVAEPPRGFPRFESSLQCRECHPTVFHEWLGSHHQISYLNPEVRQLSDDFRNKECQACHLPRPVAMTGFGRRTLPRSTTPEEGVSCLTCHLDVDGRILGRHDNDAAGCRPRASDALTDVALCESCHNQHQTTDQWRASAYAAAGTDCNDCHMGELPRSASGRVRTGFHHGFLASHDRPTLRKSLEFTASLETEAVVLTVRNTGAGHNLPTEERSRALDVMVRFENADGTTGEWQQAYRFRLPYRDEPLPDTTLPAGAERAIRVERPAHAVALETALWYRLSPYSVDGDPLSTRLHHQRFALRDDTGQAIVQAAVPVSVSADTESDRRPPWVPDRDQAWVEERAASLANVPVIPEEGPASLTTAAPGLSPRLAGFEQQAARAAPAPEAAEAARLAELVQAAFVPGLADEGLAQRSYDRLMASEHARFALEQGLADAEPAVRSQCAYELGQRGEPASLLPLILRVKDEKEPSVLLWLANAIVQLGNHSVVPQLRWLMQREDTANQAGLAAMQACAALDLEVGEQPTYVELDGFLIEVAARWRNQGQVPGFPGEADAETAARIARHLVNLEQFQLREVDEARFVLGHLGALGVPMLREALQAQEPYLRTHALEIVTALGPVAASALPQVQPLLQDALTRVDAARALGHLGRRDACDALRGCLDSEDLDLRAAAAEALGRLGDPADRERLTALWSDEAQPLDVRVRAAFGLACLDPEHAARSWLQERREAGDYHLPTVQELLDELARR